MPILNSSLRTPVPLGQMLIQICILINQVAHYAERACSHMIVNIYIGPQSLHVSPRYALDDIHDITTHTRQYKGQYVCIPCFKCWPFVTTKGCCSTVDPCLSSRWSYFPWLPSLPIVLPRRATFKGLPIAGDYYIAPNGNRLIKAGSQALLENGTSLTGYNFHGYVSSSVILYRGKLAHYFTISLCQHTGCWKLSLSLWKMPIIASVLQYCNVVCTN